MSDLLPRKMLSVNRMASGPEVLMMPIAPPGAVEMAQMVMSYNDVSMDILKLGAEQYCQQSN